MIKCLIEDFTDEFFDLLGLYYIIALTLIVTIIIFFIICS